MVKTMGTPLTQIVKTTGTLDVHSVQGGGSGDPGVCESPARVAVDSKSASARETSSFIGSPHVEVIELGGYAARHRHDTKDTDPALAYFRKLADAHDYDALTRFCLERYTLAPDVSSIVRWKKDLSIAYSLQGQNVEAESVLRSAEEFASGITGTLRGKYENQLGIVLGRLGRTSLALDHFDCGYQYLWSVGDISTCARVDHNRARALVTRGEYQKAMRYFNQALDYARANNDYRLEMEVCASLVEFEGVL